MFGKKERSMVLVVRDLDDMFVKAFYYVIGYIFNQTKNFPDVIDSIVSEKDGTSKYYGYEFRFKANKKQFNAISTQVLLILEVLNVKATVKYTDNVNQ